MEFLKNKYGSIEALSVKNTTVLKIELTGFVPESAFKHLWETTAHYMEERPWDAFLVNAQQIRVIAPDTQQWLVNQWLTPLCEKHSCQCRVAVVDAQIFLGALW